MPMYFNAPARPDEGQGNDYRLQTNGANPFPPSDAEIERLRAAVSRSAYMIPEVNGALLALNAAQRQIGDLLGMRAYKMRLIGEETARFEKMRTDLAVAPKGTGNIPDSKQIDTWLSQATAQPMADVERIDRQIQGLQSDQRNYFELASRYVPSF